MEYNKTGPNAKCSLLAIFHYFCASLWMKIIYSSVKNKYNYLIIYILKCFFNDTVVYVKNNDQKSVNNMR